MTSEAPTSWATAFVGWLVFAVVLYASFHRAGDSSRNTWLLVGLAIVSLVLAVWIGASFLPR